MPNDFMDGENFPGRPDHPDFWLLSEAALWVDGKSEDTPIPEIVGTAVDFNSAMYMAKQRIAKFYGFHPDNVSPKLIAVYLDAITIGARIQRRR